MECEVQTGGGAKRRQEDEKEDQGGSSGDREKLWIKETLTTQN